jgi:hypothetical protein
LAAVKDFDFNADQILECNYNHLPSYSSTFFDSVDQLNQTRSNGYGLKNKRPPAEVTLTPLRGYPLIPSYAGGR